MRPCVAYSEEDVVFAPFVFGSFPILVRRLVTYHVRAGRFNEDARGLFHFSALNEGLVRFYRNEDQRRYATNEILGTYEGCGGLSIQYGHEEGFQDEVHDRSTNEASVDQRGGRVYVSGAVTNGDGLFAIEQPRQ